MDNELKVDEVAIHRVAAEHRTMSEMEFEALKADIQENGQIVPIILYKNKCVDGRHRLRALSDLGEEHVKYIKLPGNMSLTDVRNKVLGTEIRRSDNVAQKAIRAFRLYESESTTQEEAAVRVGVNQSDVSKVSKIKKYLGEATLDSLYDDGFLVIDKKKITQLRIIIKLLIDKKDKPQDREYEAPTEDVASGYSLLKGMYESGRPEELLLMATRARNLAAKLMEI